MSRVGVFTHKSPQIYRRSATLHYERMHSVPLSVERKRMHSKTEHRRLCGAPEPVQYIPVQRKCKAKLSKTFTHIKSTVYKTHAQRHIHIHHLKKKRDTISTKITGWGKKAKAEGPPNKNGMLLSRQQRHRPTSSRRLVLSANSFRKGSANIFFFLWVA